MTRPVEQNRHECYEANVSTSAILDFPNIALYIVKWNVPLANNAYCGITTFRTFPTVATPSTCFHLTIFMEWFKFKMSSDVGSDQKDLFQILTTNTDKVLEFSLALEKNMLIRSGFFTLCRSMATLVCLFTNDLEMDKRSFIWNLKLCSEMLFRNGSQVCTSKVARFPLNFVNSSVSTDRNCSWCC